MLHALSRRSALLAALMSGTVPALAQDAQPILIGYDAAMTGPLATYDSVDGARCMVDRINEKGGVIGRPLQLEARDMKSDGVLSAVVGQELIDLGVSAIIAPPSDDTAIPVAALALPLNMAVMTVGSTQVQFPMASPTNSYLTAFGDNLSAAASAQYAAEQGHKTVALMISRDFGSYGIALPEYWAKAFEHHGGTVVGRVNYNIGLSDYSAQVAEVAAMEPKPELIVGGFISPEAGVMPRQFQQAGLDVKFFGTDGFDDPNLLPIAGDAANTITFATHGFPSEGSDLKAFYDDCTARGYTVQNVFFGLAGETIMLLADAITRAGSSDPAAINAALAETENFRGLTSKTITYKGQNGVPAKELTIVQIKDGAFTPVAQFVPDYVPEP
ncbi:ABC transporter substrate-binding protein [Tabrizicola sp. M-4]|uniref:ABC transporter substrate-binding protein n=1 Tax=Tabrizicola sp. M-4 TaxID=3055847 RepID=UPI003DA8DE71